MEQHEITEILNRPASQELLARDLLRMAYVAKDGTPRNVPIAFTWNGSEIVVCTTKNAPKLPSLRHNPEVALTIDTEVHPPKILLIRGRSGAGRGGRHPGGVPADERQLRDDPRAAGRVGGRGPFALRRHGPDRHHPTWAKLIDFETTLPTAVEQLVQQRAERRTPETDLSWPEWAETNRGEIMAKYLLLEHYRGARPPFTTCPMDRWTPEEVTRTCGTCRISAHGSIDGEHVDVQALTTEGTFVRSDGEGAPRSPTGRSRRPRT